jgi:hypothetical protein
VDHLVGAITAPVRTFESISRHPTWRLALVLLALLGAIAVWIGYGKVEPGDFMAYLEASGRPLPPSFDAEQALRFARVFGVTAAVIFAPLMYLALAGIFLWLLRMMGAELDYRRSLAVTTHGMLPFAVASIVGLAIATTREEIAMRDVEGGAWIPSHLGVFAGDDAGNLARAALSSVDLFSVWCIVLLGLGYAIVGRVGRSKAFTAVGIVWGIGILVKLGLAALR